MLKYYVCVIFLVLTCINLNATANITIKDIFCKTYTEKSDAYFNGMSEIKNNKIAISGVYHENKDNQIATVIGNNGEIIWQDFRDPGWDHARFRSCIILENLDIIFGGMQNAQGTNYFDPIFVKYDSAGTEIDYKNIDLPGTNDIRTIVQLSNKNIAYLGKNEPDKQFVGLIDSNLQEIKRNEFDCYSDFQQLTTILPDKNNNLYAVGAYNGNKPGIIKFDSDLNLLWGKTVNDNENREVYSANLYKNEIVLGGQDTDDSLAYLIKTDTSGNQIWERTISPNSYSNSKVMGIKFHNSYILVTVRDYSNDIKTIQRLNVYNLEGDQIESYILFNSEPFTNYPGWNGKSIVSNENNIYISGYIINNDTRIPALTKVNISIEDSFLDSLSWYIRVQASTNNYNDDYNYIGVAKGATNLFDSNFDEVEPPPPPENYTSIYLPHPEWDTTLGDKFSKDIRPEISLKDTMQVWYFDFFTTEGGEAKLDFLFNDIPEVPVVLENLETKERTNISNKNTYSFESIADSIYSFRISIGDTTAPDLKLGKSCNGPAILISDSIHNFKWMTNDGYRVDSVKIWFTSDSGETYKEINRQNYIDSYNWMVIDTTVTYGNLLKISSKDYAGNEKIKVSERPFAIIGDSLSNHIFEGWNLWGVPLIPKKDSIENIIGDDFTDYWVTYEYKNNGYTNNDVFQLGKGYWLGIVESAILDIIGEPIQKDTSISLSLGWNLFSNPLILDIDKDSLIFIKDGVSKKTVEAVSTGWVNNIYSYNRNGYITPTTIEPFQGYWISVLEPDISMKFPIHRQSNKGINKLASNEWRIKFRAKTKTAQDNITVIGTSSEATDGFDNEFDEIKPPIPPNPDYVSLNIEGNSSYDSILSNHYTKDIRSIINEEAKSWKFNLQSSKDTITLSWIFYNFPEDLEVGIDTNHSGDFNNLRNFEELSFMDNNSFEIKIGENILSIWGNKNIPKIYSLEQNYPNPFNSTTTIKFCIPYSSKVKINIFDINGEQVETLLNDFKEAGYYTKRWKANNLSSGIYFYKIQAKDFIDVKKCVLIK